MSHQIEGEIEGRDGRHHPHRSAKIKAEVPLAGGNRIQGNRLAVDPFGLLAGESEGGDRSVRFDPGPLQRLPRLSGDGGRELLAAVADGLGGSSQDLRPLMGREPGHDRRRALGGRKGSIHFLAAGRGDGSDHLAGVLVRDLQQGPTLDPLSVDKEPVLLHPHLVLTSHR